MLSLPPGIYTVTVDRPGFAKYMANDQAVTVGQMKDLPVSLSGRKHRDGREVTSEAALVETTRSSTTDTVDQRRIDNLPINGRNYINFTLTDSQVVRDNAPNIGAAPTSGLNMGGQRARANLVNVDGADATDNSINGVRSTVSQEAVQEFQIITNSYAAEYGRASGGVVNIITRSGSNAISRGCVRISAQSRFSGGESVQHGSESGLHAGTGGAAFGGPIKKDKTYYYFSYEITRRHETGFSSIGTEQEISDYDLNTLTRHNGRRGLPPWASSADQRAQVGFLDRARPAGEQSRLSLAVALGAAVRMSRLAGVLGHGLERGLAGGLYGWTSWRGRTSL